MIKLQVIGHLGKDATTNQVNGKNVINFNVAHTEKFKDSNGNQKEKTTWVECSYWSDNRISAYMKKGTQVYVEGTPEVRTYPKNDGTQGVSLSIRVGMVQLLSSGQGNGGGNDRANTDVPRHEERQAAGRPNPNAEPDEPVDDLPF